MPIKVSTGNQSQQFAGNSDTQMPQDSLQAQQPAIPTVSSTYEYADPNSIKVTIADGKTPIVILYGPPSCGKTMTLIRLTRYLLTQGYTVVPEKTFRPSADTKYKSLCDGFDQFINSNTAAQGTSHIDFMLVKVLKDGRPVCQLLEAPGELYFNPDAPDAPYPPYVNEILNGSNRKVWLIMVEPDWSDATPRKNYVTRIQRLKSQMTVQDKVLFVFNKIDKTPFVINAGHVNVKAAISNVENLYPNIFTPFKNQNPLTKWLTKYNCEFVPFTTGNYSPSLSGGFTFTESHSIYAQKLWNAMHKLLMG